jgi:queuine tRNA-ribosyltransferase accessory subunit
MAQLPEEMFQFILESGTAATVGVPRLGRLIARNTTIATPHYAALTSRGTVPHISPDVLQRHTRVSAVYLGLEDCTFRERSSCSLLTR